MKKIETGLEILFVVQDECVKTWKAMVNLALNYPHFMFSYALLMILGVTLRHLPTIGFSTCITR